MAENATDAKATFSINLEGNVAEKSSEDAAALEELRTRLARSQETIRQNSAALRSLRGSSEEVTSAREKLKAALDAEKDAVSAANVQLLKQGTSYAKLADEAKKLELEQKKLADKMKAKDIDEAKKRSDALGNAVKLAGGPVEQLTGRFDALKGVLGGAGAGMAGMTLVVAGAAAAVAALVAGIGAAAVALTKFIVVGADAARNMNILRLATTKTEENARNLGTQVDALASKISTPKEELNALAASLGRTRLSGQAIVDTFNLVGRAGDAMGDDVGNTLKDIVTRGQQFNRFQLNPLELQGKGIGFNDVAGELAKNLKVGIGDAQQMLFQGTVTIDQGAKALRQAVEKNFSKINDAKLLSLDSQTLKLKEDLQALTSGVRLEPLLRGFAELRSLFSQSSVMGQTLKSAITTIGNTFGPAFQGALPGLKKFFEGAVIGALDVGIAFVRLGLSTRQIFAGMGKDFDIVKAAELPFLALAKAIDAVRVSALALDLAYAPLSALLGNKSVDLVRLQKDLEGLGLRVPQGIAAGVAAGAPQVTTATNELAEKMQGEFANKLKIHSPSRVFVDNGVDVAEGAGLGVRRGTPGAVGAVEDLGSDMASAGSHGGSGGGQGASPALAPSSSGGGGGGAGAGAGGITLRLEAGAIVIQTSGGNGKEIAKELGTQSFVAQFTSMLQVALKGAGIPTQAVPAK